MIHEMKLNPLPFEQIVAGEKTIEYRLWDKKRRLLNIGDKIVFTNLEDRKQIEVIVKAIHKALSFAELYTYLLSKKIICEDQFDPNVMYDYYSKEDEQKYGVVGIEIVLVKG